MACNTEGSATEADMALLPAPEASDCREVWRLLNYPPNWLSSLICESAVL